MKRIKTLAAICIMLPVAVLAQSNTPRVDQREANQQARIERGVASGNLTPREANRLERGQQHVDNVEARAKSDGVVSRRERLRLHEAQNVQSRQIDRQAHDRQHDFNHNGRTDRPQRR